MRSHAREGGWRKKTSAPSASAPGNQQWHNFTLKGADEAETAAREDCLAPARRHQTLGMADICQQPKRQRPKAHRAQLGSAMHQRHACQLLLECIASTRPVAAKCMRDARPGACPSACPGACPSACPVACPSACAM
mmetsp:Transcript_37642/g.111314  ORF Transcript_37642/g.111314 Transcript_37642/m.111314 type:complete len:136 (-) Transcript_37642:1927-2334(-)